MADGVTIDNDGDGIPDWWLVQYFGHPAGQASDQSFAWDDPAGAGLSNFQKYLHGLNPLVPARPYLQPLLSPTNGNFALNIQGLFGRTVTLEVSSDLTNWQTLTNLTSTNAMIYFEDLGRRIQGPASIGRWCREGPASVTIDTSGAVRVRIHCLANNGGCETGPSALSDLYSGNRKLGCVLAFAANSSTAWIPLAPPEVGQQRGFRCTTGGTPPAISPENFDHCRGPAPKSFFTPSHLCVANLLCSGICWHQR
jgi:hypothetical protein